MSGAYRVVEPLALHALPEGRAALVIEHVGFVNAEHWLRWTAHIKWLRQFALLHVANWLVRFHQAGKPKHGDFQDFFDKKAFFERVDDLPNEHGAVAALKARVLASDLSSLIAAQATTQVPLSRVHGDFTPANIIITPKQAIGIDFERARQGCIYVDIAKFLSIMTRYLLIRSRRARQAILKNDVLIFEAAYEDRGLQLDRRLLFLFYLDAVLERVERIVRRKAREGKPLAEDRHLPLLCQSMNDVLDDLAIR